MPARVFSLLIVDQDRQVRECLGDIFRGTGFDVNMAESHASALESLPVTHYGAWPDIVIVGETAQPGRATSAFLEKLKSERPGALGRASFIVFPSFNVALGNGERSAKSVKACRLTTVSNLISLVHGLANKSVVS